MSGFFLVRHGETTKPGLFLGCADPPLSDTGRRQAERIAAALPPPQTLVSSGLRRATETAAILAAHWGVEARVDPRLDEIGYGAWDGLRWEEIERRWPAESAAKLHDWWAVSPPGGEPFAAFVERLRGGWGDLLSAPRPVVVVAHAGVNAVLAELTRCESDEKIDWDRVLRHRQNLGEWLEF